MLVILTRNIDLSVGSIVGVTAYVTGEYLPDASRTAAAGGGRNRRRRSVRRSGSINGVLVAYGGVPSIIVTLGTLALYRTWLVDLAEAQTITADSCRTG